MILQCYVSASALSDENLDSLGAFCRRMGRETNQGEIGVVVDGNYIAIRDFGESA